MWLPWNSIRAEKGPVKEISPEARTESIPKITAFINEELENRGVAMWEKNQIDVALDEILILWKRI